MKKARLTRERVLLAAVQLVDDKGIDGLTMRSLGRSLGVQAMSLYRYVPNKETLLDGIQQAIVNQMEPVPSTAWPELLDAQARELRRVLALHPRAIPLFARPAADADVFDALFVPVQALQDAGFTDADALRAVQALLAFVVGQAMWQYTPDGERAVDDEFDYGLRAMLLGMAQMHGC